MGDLITRLTGNYFADRGALLTENYEIMTESAAAACRSDHGARTLVPSAAFVLFMAIDALKFNGSRS